LILKLHTFDYIRERSSFLLAVILAGASKAFHPPLHLQLRAHAEELLAKTFIRGDKSVEVVQGIMAFTYWKDPDDTRTWLLIGYAIRMCIELGWHELKAVDVNDYKDELQIREAMNVRRTWLILFVYDRSISSQMGRPWMIEQNELIKSADSWYRHPYACAGGDLLLSAFTRLRIISSEILELAYPTRSSPRPQRAQILLKLLNADITRWEGDWLSLFDDEGVAPCQRFLVRFYGLHLRLLLNSFSLQESLRHSKEGLPIPKQALWTCYSSAVGMLELISEEFGPLKLLYFAQDSVHVMTAYAAIFLIKVLLSFQGSLRSEFEGPSISAIRNAAATFNEQCASPRTGCALQARFLTNVVEKYESMKPQPVPVKAPKELAQGRQVRPGLTTQDVQRAEDLQHSNDIAMMNSGMMGDAMGANTSGMVGLETMGVGPYTAMDQDAAGYQVDFGNSTFADDDMWETLFANAGFRITHGVFMPDSIDGNP